MISRLYYAAKPFVPSGLRLKCRRSYTRRQLNKPGLPWPIDPISNIAPHAWPGWPYGKQATVILTHDVESAVGYRKLPKLVALERELGFTSTINLVPERDYEVSMADLEQYKEANFEIGVHGLKHDGKLFQSRQRFDYRKGRINEYLNKWGARGFRAPLMQSNLNWIGELNIDYDMSTFDTDPFEPQPNGSRTIYPFWCERHRLGVGEPTGNPLDGFVEFGYTLPQDSTLFVLLGETNIDIWKRKIEWLFENGGLILVNTHPDYMRFDARDDRGYRYDVDLYRQLLEFLKEKLADDVWVANAGAVADFYKKEVVGKTPRTEWEKAGVTRPLATKRAYVAIHSYYPDDPRPRRAAESMAKAGMSIDVTCLSSEGSPKAPYILEGVCVHEMGLGKKRGSKLQYLYEYSYTFVASVCAQLRRLPSTKIDVVHVHNMPDFLVFSALPSKLMGARVILDLHDPMPELMGTIFGVSEGHYSVRILKFLEKISVRYADSVITVNLACKKMFGERTRSGSKISVIMNSPDEAIFSYKPADAKARPAGPLKLMYHGSILERNGLDLLVSSIELLRDRGVLVTLDVYGKPTAYEMDVREAVDKKGLGDRVKFQGPKPLGEIPSAIDDCDLGVIPNKESTFTHINTPTRIFEYLSRGKPALAPNTGGVTDYFSEESLNFFQVGSRESLADELEKVSKNMSALPESAAKGQMVYDQHRWETAKSDWLKIVVELLK